MADGKIKISELGSALQLSDNAKFPFSQDNGGTETTYGAEITQIARKIAEGVSLTNLETTTKTLVGAINELSHLGNPIILGTSAPTAQQGANGNLYVQYTEGTGGADDEVDAIFVKIDGAWCEISTGGGGGSGGHTIVDDSGTSLTQRTNLQFNGAYSEDNSADDTTEVNVVRSMTKAQYNQLSAAERAGLIKITDEDSITATEIPIQSGSATNTKDYIDSGLSGKADTSTTYTKSEVDAKVPKYFDLTITSGTSDSGISPYSYYGNSSKTDANIHNILSVSVIDTQFNNPSITALYSISGTTYNFIVYSARSGNIKIRVLYN